MVRAADHLQVRETVGHASAHKRIDEFRIAGCRRIRVQQFRSYAHAAPAADVISAPLNDLKHSVAPDLVRIAHIEREPYPAGNAVNRAGKDLAHADGRDCVDRARRFRGGFNGEREFGRRAECVVTVGHEERARVSALAFNVDIEACWSRDVGDDADRNAIAFEKWALFDM